jgi:hypothetical protein
VKRFSSINKSFIHFSLFCFILLFLVGSCSEPAPNDVLTKYLDARYIDNDYKKAMKYVSTNDKILFEKYLPKLPPKNDPLQRYTADRTSYTINNFDISEDQASAEVFLEWPDTLADPEVFMAASLSSAMEDKDIVKELERLYAEKHNGEEIPLMSMNITYNLIKEKDGWKVNLDLESKKGIRIGEYEFPPI